MKYHKLLKLWLIALIITFGFEITLSQNGKLVLIGGGMERSGINSWNYELFQRIVNNAENGKVLVIGNSVGDGWLEDNFVTTWGANYSKELVINSENADLQSVYDTIISYDAVYIRGGDQYYYYNNWINTKTQEALEYIFANGGVLAGTSAGMHILSEVIFTDDTGFGIFPYEAIENPLHEYITLHDDLFDFLPNIIADSHFTERGRFGRLLGFMANRKINNHQNVIGWGIDDLTGVFIDENNIATVYGTGCMNIYIPEESSFSQNYDNNGVLLGDNIKVIQLLQGSVIDINDYSIVTNMSQESQIQETIEYGNYTVFASGSNNINDNLEMLNQVAAISNPESKPLLILTGSNHNIANQFKTHLESMELTNIQIFTADENTGENIDLTTLINDAYLFMFIDNNIQDFATYMTTENGLLTGNKLRENSKVSVFIGENSALAGTVYIDNLFVYDAAYFGDLEFYPALNIIPSSVIVPDTYRNSNFYENTASALPYTMCNNNLKYGIWLNNKNFIKVFPEAGQAYLTGGGTSPIMILRNESEFFGNSQQTSTGGGTPRQISGFDKMYLSLIDESVNYLIGDIVSSNIAESNNLKFSLFPNPASDYINIVSETEIDKIQIYSLNGQLLFSKDIYSNSVKICLNKFSKGLHYIKVYIEKNISIQKVIFIS